MTNEVEFNKKQKNQMWNYQTSQDYFPLSPQEITRHDDSFLPYKELPEKWKWFLLPTTRNYKTYQNKFPTPRKIPRQEKDRNLNLFQEV